MQLGIDVGVADNPVILRQVEIPSLKRDPVGHAQTLGDHPWSSETSVLLRFDGIQPADAPGGYEQGAIVVQCHGAGVRYIFHRHLDMKSWWQFHDQTDVVRRHAGGGNKREQKQYKPHYGIPVER